MVKAEGIRVYLRLRPPATAQHSSILGATSNDSGSKGGPRGAASATALDTASCDYYVENSFEGATVHLHADKRIEGEYINNTSEDYAFSFRRVFEPSVGQEEVFSSVAQDCVSSALQGYNSTIFAYGQTGSGKTYSITGGTESYADRGIIPRALGMIYDEAAKRSECAWTVSIAYLQIYNDKGQDLLNHGKDARTLDDLPVVTVHELDDDTTILKNLEQHSAPTLADALNLLFLGDTNRLYCETPMNRTSSRSHCVFTVFIEARTLGSSVVVRRSKLNLVDLAGSERVSKSGVAGTILTEAKHINLSLHYLAHVIVALSEQAEGRRDHVPFRNSFMTMVLRDSLGGNCRTSMLATAHLAKGMLPETISTCGFAQRVARIQQHARVNESIDPLAMVARLKAEVAQLKDQLGFFQRQQGGENDPDRALSEEERVMCRGLVDAYVAKKIQPVSSSEQQDSGGGGGGSADRFDGFQGDLARIYYCFQVMRDRVTNTNTTATTINAVTAAATTASGVDTAGYETQIGRLQVSLQQRENEVNTMFELVSRAQGGARFNAGTQTSPQDYDPNYDNNGKDNSSTARTAAAAADAATAAATTGLARVQDLAQRGKLSAAEAAAAGEYFRRKEQAISTTATQMGNGIGNGNGNDADDSSQPGNPTATTAAEAASGYNLAALSDAALVEDRAAAFDAFKQSYQHYARVEATKTELKERYDGCKETAAQLNAEVDAIKAVKTRVQRLRAERAVEGVESADELETGLLTELHTRRERYNTLAAGLRANKETIDGMHVFMKRAQEQLTRDFEAWFSARGRQVALAVNAGGNNNISSVGDTSFAAAATTTAAAAAAASPTGRIPSKPSSPPFAPPSSSPAAAPCSPVSMPLHRSSGGGGSGGSSTHPSSAPLPSPSPSSSSNYSAASRGVAAGRVGGSAEVLPSSGGGGEGWGGGGSNPNSNNSCIGREVGWMGQAQQTALGSFPFSGAGASPTPLGPTTAAAAARSTTTGVRSTPPPYSLNSNQQRHQSPTPTSLLLPVSHSARNHHLLPIAASGETIPPQTAATTTRGGGGSGVAVSGLGSSVSLLSSDPSTITARTAASAEARRNPYAPAHRSTGNAAADEQLAALYRMRDSLRGQMQ